MRGVKGEGKKVGQKGIKKIRGERRRRKFMKDGVMGV